MTDAISALVTAFLITIIAVPATIKLATKFGLVDDPKLRPHPAHVHKTIIPRAGGLPIYLGIILAAAIFLPIEKHLIGIFLGITILLSLGLADDKLTTFNPYLRLFLLFLAAFCAVGSGIGVAFITNPLSHFNLPGLLSTNIIRLDQIIIPFNFLGDHSIVLIADIFAFFWIVTLTQVINWSKGVDGQMPGITLVAAITLGLFSLKLVSQGDSNQLGVATLSFITAGSALAFLIFNWYPAKILPGFSGSTILAFMLATLSILSGAKLATALLVLAIPSIDFIYTFLRRVLQGKSPVWGDRGHLHHKLLDLGWTPVQISLFYIFGSAILGGIALLLDTGSKLFIILLLAVLFFGFILWLNSFGALSKQRDPGNG